VTVETTKDRGATVPPAAPPELLAALEVERLRGAVERAEARSRSCYRETVSLDSWCRLCGQDSPWNEGHKADCPFAALAAPPPDLGPLRELVAAWRAARLDSVIMPARLAAALDALLAAYPCLGEE